jgi:GGDEF domain-containing protein
MACDTLGWVDDQERNAQASQGRAAVVSQGNETPSPGHTGHSIRRNRHRRSHGWYYPPPVSTQPTMPALRRTDNPFRWHGLAGVAMRPVFVFLLLCAAALAWAQPQTLSTPLARVWIDDGAQASPDQALAQLAGPAAQAYSPQTVWPFASGRALWFSLPLPDLGHRVAVSVPYPGVDGVEIFWRDTPDGPWQTRRAGDSLANAQWPLPFLYPAFLLERSPPTALLRVQHNIPTALPVDVDSAVNFVMRAQTLLLIVGGYLGVVALLLVLSAAHAFVYRQGLFLLYALDVVMLAITQMALIGAAARFLWPDAPVLADRAPSVFPMLALVTATWLVRALVQPLPWRWVDRLLLVWMVMGLGLALRFAWVGLTPKFLVANLYFMLSMPIFLSVLVWHALRRSQASWWFVAGKTAVLISAGVVAASNVGWLPRSFWTPYIAQAGSALEIPLLLFGLLYRSRRERELQVRRASLQTVDPTTGLLNERVTLQRLAHAIERAQAHGADARDQRVALCVRLRGLSAIESEQGRGGRNTALVHAASVLLQVAQPGDTVGRVAAGDFLLLPEAPLSRDQAQGLAVRIVAQGLSRAFRTVERGEGLRLQVCVARGLAAWPDAPTLISELQTGLDELARTPRRGVQLLEPPVGA